MPPNLRVGRFLLFAIADILVFHYCSDSLQATLGLLPHSASARSVDLLCLSTALHITFAVLRQFRQGGHAWLRR